MFNIKDYRIDAIRLSDILNDYGCSCGEFAMEPEALKKFEAVSEFLYTVEVFDTFPANEKPDLFVVNVSKKSKQSKISEILEAFRVFDGVYKREEIDAAIGLKEEITPHLIKILENLLADPNAYIENNDLYDHTYALMLLGYFKEPKAHKVIIDIFSLQPDLPYNLFGDLITEDLPIILLNTCNGSTELISSLILKKEADEFCRASASQALAYAVIEGYTTREETLTFLESLFTGTEAEMGSAFWGMLATTACNLYPAEIMDTVKQAYENELIDTMSIKLSDFEEDLQLGKKKCLERFKKNFEARRLDDLHNSMSWWACFGEKPNVPPSGSLPDLPPKKSRKKKSQSKKKQAKISKKKNRRKKK